MSTFNAVARVALIVGWGLVACSRGSEQRDVADSGAAATATPAPTTDSAAGSVGSMSESQIVAAVVAANSTDSAHGAVAVTKASNADVKEFGRMMVEDHGSLNKQVVALAGRINATPATTPPALMASSMQGMSGAEFDRAYIDHEVTMHQDVLNKLDRDLIPSASNSELRTLLQQARGSVQAHLDRARQLQGTLSGAR